MKKQIARVLYKMHDGTVSDAFEFTGGFDVKDNVLNFYNYGVIFKFYSLYNLIKVDIEEVS